jgi:hypothetical protein
VIGVSKISSPILSRTHRTRFASPILSKSNRKRRASPMTIAEFLTHLTSLSETFDWYTCNCGEIRGVRRMGGGASEEGACCPLTALILVTVPGVRVYNATADMNAQAHLRMSLQDAQDIMNAADARESHPQGLRTALLSALGMDELPHAGSVALRAMGMEYCGHKVLWIGEQTIN